MASDEASKALAKRSADSALMPPPPQPKRIKRPVKVLDEETYTDALSHIISRDFFPGLLEAESQQEYLNALDSKDSEWIATAGRKLAEVMTPRPSGRRIRGRRGIGMTPSGNIHERGGETPKGWRGDTPMSVVSSTSTSTTQTEKPDVDTNMSLSAFQTKYTSEDNESFYKLLDKQNLKRSEKYAWMWAGNKIAAPRQIAYRRRQDQIQASKNAQEAEDGQQLISLESIHADTRPAMPDSWRSKPDNNFMFAPSSIEDYTQTVQQKAEENCRAPPKAVTYDNTRLAPILSPDSDSVPPSPSLSAVQDALAGRPKPTASEPGYSGGETPRVNGYAFVDSEPSPPPPQLKSSWDTEEGGSRLRLLGSGDATPNPFKINDNTKREELHHRMVDRVAKSKRTTKREAEVKTPVSVPRFASSPRIAKEGLTPAAQKLLGRVGAGRTPAGSGWSSSTPKVGSGLRAAWTPKG